MSFRIITVAGFLLTGVALSSCAPPYACPPGYHLGPYGRRCWPNAGGPYPPPPPGAYAPPPGAYAPPPGAYPPPPGGPPPAYQALPPGGAPQPGPPEGPPPQH